VFSFNIDLRARAERERKLAEAQAARERVQGLMGKAQAPYQMGEEELFPGEIQEEAISSGLPVGTIEPGQAPPSLMTKGTGLVGGEISPMEFYGGLMTTPGYQDVGAQGLRGLMASKGQQGFTLSPSQVRFDPQGQIIAQVAAEEKKAGPGSTFDISTKLRKEFTGQTKDFVKVRDANRRIGAAAERPTAAGDMALIFNFMKVLDPGSTVREGEFATAQNATGVPSRIMNTYNNILRGERLNPTQRTDFVSQANNLYEAQLGGLSQLENQYTALSKTFGVDPKNVIVDYRVKAKEKPATPSPPPGFK